MKQNNFEAKISVRNLVEFILKSGDIDNSGTGTDADAMQEGARIHRKIQKSMGGDYKAEVALQKQILLERGENDSAVMLTVEGRADGIFTEEGLTIIDEIKSSYGKLENIEEPVQVHLAQAKCYAYIYAEQKDCPEIGVQMTYVNLDNEEIKRFNEVYSFESLKEWFDALVKEYSKWLFWQADWRIERNESIKKLTFPFEYRPGQRELVASVYKTITRGRKLFIEAPTGVGKTISTVFPAIWAVGEGKASRIFYLTAKTIARTVAENTFALLTEKGLKFRYLTITAKEKICILDTPSCNPGDCPRARGHLDRVNDCVFDIITHEENINRDLINQYAEKHCVCPFEMCLDVSLWVDAIVCDYNYAFDPNASLKRFFADGSKNDYIFLIDEAHNLLERAREMYSAELVKEDFLEVKRIVAGKSKRVEKQLDACNKNLLAFKRQCDDFQVWDEADDFYNSLQRLYGAMEEFLDSNSGGLEDKTAFLDLYFNVIRFLKVYEEMDEAYRIYTDYTGGGNFRMKLLCMEPAAQLKTRMDNTLSSILFSATLLPMNYYKEQLGGEKDDYAVYAPSPFSKEKRLVMIGSDVSTVYKRRGSEEYRKIVEYIEKFVSSKVGNYLIFFSSYKMMEEVLQEWNQEVTDISDILTNDKQDINLGLNNNRKIVAQKRDMSEQEKELFMAEFHENPTTTLVGCTVMGGVFSEGIDLTGDRLTGAVIVGCGLPMVGNERELFKYYFDEKGRDGFEYSYLYPGMNKVMQSAGRVIRTVEDIGTILLLDERFTRKQYVDLFPREWFPYEIVNINNMKQRIEEFYKGQG